MCIVFIVSLFSFVLDGLNIKRSCGLYACVCLQWTGSGSRGRCGRAAPRRAEGGASRGTGSATGPSSRASLVPGRGRRCDRATRRSVQVSERERVCLSDQFHIFIGFIVREGSAFNP